MVAKLLRYLNPYRNTFPSLKELITKESQIGGALFGPIPAGHRREFFCMDEKTWIWYEEWYDLDNKRQSMTTRYEIQPRGIVKAQDGQRYQYVTGEEAKNLLHAMKQYHDKTLPHVYGQKPADIYV